MHISVVQGVGAFIGLSGAILAGEAKTTRGTASSTAITIFFIYLGLNTNYLVWPQSICQLNLVSGLTSVLL